MTNRQMLGFAVILTAILIVGMLVTAVITGDHDWAGGAAATGFFGFAPLMVAFCESDSSEYQ